MWNSDQHVGVSQPVIVDPLLMTGWQFESDHSNVAAWFDEHERPDYVISVVLCQHHWIPFVCMMNPGHVEVVYLTMAEVDDRCIAHIVDLFVKVRYATHKQVTAMDGVMMPHCCGAQAISFIEHAVLNRPFEESQAQIVADHATYRQMFETAVTGTHVTCYPWIWGSGHDTAEQAGQLLRPILKEHGVHPDKLQSRAQQAINVLGADEVVTACKSKSPWRSLKALGNNMKFQFILPAELQDKVRQKAGDDEGLKPPKKVKPKHATKKEEDIQLDPSKLVLPEGVFQSDKQTLQQITVNQLGPLAEGVAIATASEAEPFVRANKLVSTGPLALLILHAPTHMWMTSLPHVELTVPARCVVNQEPLLLHATLVQLGAGKVEKTTVVAAQNIEPAKVVTIKATVYKDEIHQTWDQLTSGPVKYVLQQFSCLRLCSEPQCRCDAWQNEEQEPVQTAILDVWRRQFLRPGFKQSPPGEASMFSVCLRIPQCLQARLLASSGNGGVYLEPRTLDAKEVDRTFDIVWVPKADKQSIQHLRQTTPASVGLARVADRFGLRVRSEQAKEVHQLIRPDAVFLAQGPRLQYSVGQFPMALIGSR